MAINQPLFLSFPRFDDDDDGDYDYDDDADDDDER